MTEKNGRSHLSHSGYCTGASVRMRFAARFASSQAVEGLRFGAAAAAWLHLIGVRVEQLPLQDWFALRRAVQRRWRRCAGFTWAFVVVVAALHLATIPTPNVLKVAWLLLYKARGTRPPFCFRTD